jgi:hypothetical protein
MTLYDNRAHRNDPIDHNPRHAFDASVFRGIGTNRFGSGLLFDNYHSAGNNVQQQIAAKQRKTLEGRVRWLTCGRYDWVDNSGSGRTPFAWFGR